MTKKPVLALFGALMVAMTLAGCSTPKLAEGVEYGRALPPPDQTRVGPVDPAKEYRVGPMDVLDITVFQAPDLTRPAQVDASGQISLPLVGSISVSGKTVREIQADVTKALQAKYLQSPEVTVFVKEFASQKVTVDGSVTQPGIYPLTGKTTLLQAVAMARGADRLANLKRVAIFRVVNNQRMVAVFDVEQIRAGSMDDPEIFGNDVVVIDRSGSKSVWRDIIGTVPLLAVFRPMF